MKRTLDIVISAIALAVLAPLMLLIAGLIRLTMGRPVLFRHLRPGLHGRPFHLLKFRSMRNPPPPGERPPPDAERVTPLGRLLRKTSLDELPQLLNVLKGEMSLVGPRPLTMAHLELYNSRQARRLEALPGITGLAQIKGRNLLNWEEKAEIDIWYVDHRCLALDLKILALTAVRIFQFRQVVTFKTDFKINPFADSDSSSPETREGEIKETSKKGK